jgi:hypothetical protein
MGFGCESRIDFPMAATPNYGFDGSPLPSLFFFDA